MDMLFLFLVGLCVGSFCNVLAKRLPRGEDVLVTRSHCDFCKKTLAWYELIPLFSFFLQARRCRHCHKKLSFRYPLIELIFGCVFVLIGWNMTLLALFSMSMVIVLADLEYFIIPDVTLVVIGLVALTMHPTLAHFYSALGAFIGFYFLYILTKRKGMGFGDVKLVGVLGLLLGFPNIVVSLYVAFLTGAIVGVILMIGGKAKMKTKVPFGPFLILGALISYLYGATIWQWWAQFV
ncbi:MAG: prepilin peptidase [Patescibacteria group bacterium]